MKTSGSDLKACICGRPSVGEVSDLKTVKYLCNTHWYALEKRLEDWFFRQYDKQWTGQEWYDELMINRICLNCHKPIRKDLKRLRAKDHCVCPEPSPNLTSIKA